MATKTINGYKDYSKKENSKLAFGHDYVSGLKPGKCILPFVNNDDKCMYNGLNIVDSEVYLSGCAKSVTYFRNSSKKSTKVLNFEDNKYYILYKNGTTLSFEEFLKNKVNIGIALRSTVSLDFDTYKKDFKFKMETDESFAKWMKGKDVKEEYDSMVKNFYDNFNGFLTQTWESIIDEELAEQGVDLDEMYTLDYVKGEVLEVAKAGGTQFIVFKADEDQKVPEYDFLKDKCKLVDFQSGIFYCNGSDGGFKWVDDEEELRCKGMNNARVGKIYKAYDMIA